MFSSPSATSGAPIAMPFDSLDVPAEHPVSSTEGSGKDEEANSRVTEDKAETTAIKESTDFPDGGFRAWLIVFGVRF